MATLPANDAIQVKQKKVITASGIMDGHAHHNSGATCPLPLVYAQIVEGAPVPLPKWLYKTREAAEKLIGSSFKEGVSIQKLPTFEMGQLLAKLNRETYGSVVSSMDFGDDSAQNKAGTPIATPVVAATMDMERAHIEGYRGQPIYHEESGKLFCYKRSSGEKQENEGKKIDLSHELIENKIDKSKVLKLKKWRFQFDDTIRVAKENPLHIFPLIFYDPRRYNRPSGTVSPESKDFGAWDAVFKFVATDTNLGLWLGIKMYPPLGHKPFDELCEFLPEFYHQCATNQIPILTHCSPGGMTTHEAEFYMEFDIENGEQNTLRKTSQKKQREKVAQLIKTKGRQPSKAVGYPEDWGESTDKEKRFPMDYFFKYYVHPEAWRPVLENFPDLHLCLAHFGGDEWRRGPINTWKEEPGSQWIRSTVELTKTYKNVYTDISCFNLKNSIFHENDKNQTVRTTLTKMLYWMRDRDEYKHLKNKVIFGTDWYLTHLTRGDNGAEYGNYCREFKKLLDQVDSTFWIRFTLVNPWTFYSMSKAKIQKICDALKKEGAKKAPSDSRLDQLLKIDDEVTSIKDKLAQWDTE